MRSISQRSLTSSILVRPKGHSCSSALQEFSKTTYNQSFFSLLVNFILSLASMVLFSAQVQMFNAITTYHKLVAISTQSIQGIKNIKR